MWDAWEVRLEEMFRDQQLLNPVYPLHNIFYTNHVACLVKLLIY